MRTLAERPLSKWERAKLSLLTRFHPDVGRSLLVHWRAVRELLASAPVRDADNRDRGLFEEEFRSYLDAYGGRPFVAFVKFLEGQAFRSVPLDAFGEETLEIRISDGAVSGLHFRDRSIELGTEFVWQRMRQRSAVHRYVFGSDLRQLPIRDRSLRSVFLVHIFDDLSFDIGRALEELQRIIRPGGRLIFSSASRLYGHHQTRASLGRLARLTETEFERYRALRYAVRNLHSRAELQQILSGYGMDLVEYREFLSTAYASAWDAGMTVEIGLARTPLDYLTRTPGLMRRYQAMVTDAFFRAFVLEKYSPAAGIHYFCIARKV
jgi:SAM-dependent methyltransferase